MTKRKGNTLTIDFETRSTFDLTSGGAWAYAEDPSTEILCMAFKFNEEPTHLFLLGTLAKSLDALQHQEAGVVGYISNAERHAINRIMAEADTIEAHNVGFEMALWHHVLVGKYGYEPIPIDKWRCSAAKCSQATLPRALDKAGTALGIVNEKDKDGKALMMKMCKPRTPVKAEAEALAGMGFTFERNDKGTIQRSIDALGDERIFWHEEPQQIIDLCKYCIRDVDAEHEISGRLPDLPPAEQEVFMYDLIINERGVPSDVESIPVINNRVADYKGVLEGEFNGLSGGLRSGQRAKVLNLFATKWPGTLEGYTAADVAAALKSPDLDPTARRMLEIRKSVSKTSVKKLDAFVRCSNSDGRVRFTITYHKATTGRWGGQLVQTQNFPRPSKGFDGDVVVPDFHNLSGVEFAEKHGDIMQAASDSLRSMIKASPGKKFLCADYSSIEGRVLAWLAGEEDVLNAYRAGLDMYKMIASKMFHVPYEEVDDTQRQAGKIAELAFGYGGGGKAYVQFAEQYGMDCTMALGESYKNPWRKARSKTVKYWRDCEDGVRRAIQNPGSVFPIGPHCRAKVDGEWLNIRLPSGRLIYFFDPSLRAGKYKPEIRFWGVNSNNNQWIEKGTWGGDICQSITQAVARDLLSFAIPNVERAGYPIVFSVHDELVCEVPDVKEFALDGLIAWMSHQPEWSKGIPVECDGWEGYRFRK